jgi:hypothetical protein
MNDGKVTRKHSRSASDRISMLVSFIYIKCAVEFVTHKHNGINNLSCDESFKKPTTTKTVSFYTWFYYRAVVKDIPTFINDNIAQSNIFYVQCDEMWYLSTFCLESLYSCI